MSAVNPPLPQRPKILVVDDNPANLLVVRRVLARVDADLVEAFSGNEALKATLDDEFALILLDVYMPDINGFEVAEILSQEEHARQTPIIFVTATYADDVHRLKGYGFGAADYMAKPIDPAILLSKVNVFLDLYNSRLALRAALHELSERNRQLEEELGHRRRMEDEMRQLATHDSLTGLPNRMLFMDRLGMAIERAHRHGNRFALVYLDADRFKLINDTWGHAAGDAVLAAIAGRLTDRLRGNDTVARLGGDEFALIIEDVGGDRASVLDSLAELRGLLEAPLMHEVAGNDSVALPVRASMGLALYPEDGTDGTALMHAADHAMYADKRSRTEPSENENAA